jgi:elongation factor 3
MASENETSVKVLDELMQALIISKDASAINDASAALASFVNGRIEDMDTPTKTIESLSKQLGNKKDATAREKACLAIEAIASHSEVSAHVEPYLVVFSPRFSLPLATRSRPSRMLHMAPFLP